MTATLSVLSMFVGFYAWRPDDVPGWKQAVAAGPAVAALTALLSWALLGTTFSGPDWLRTVLWQALIEAAIQFVATVIPVRYPHWMGPYAGSVSDGYRLLAILKS